MCYDSAYILITRWSFKIMKKSLMADIDESSVNEAEVDDLDSDVKEAVVQRSGWVDLEVPCSGALKKPTDVI